MDDEVKIGLASSSSVSVEGEVKRRKGIEGARRWSEFVSLLVSPKDLGGERRRGGGK